MAKKKIAPTDWTMFGRISAAGALGRRPIGAKKTLAQQVAAASRAAKARGVAGEKQPHRRQRPHIHVLGVSRRVERRATAPRVRPRGGRTARRR